MQDTQTVLVQRLEVFKVGSSGVRAPGGIPDP